MLRSSWRENITDSMLPVASVAMTERPGRSARTRRSAGTVRTEQRSARTDCGELLSAGRGAGAEERSATSLCRCGGMASRR